MSVERIAASQVALAQAQVQTAVAVRLLKTAQATEAQQTLELVHQAADAATRTLNQSATAIAGGFDVYA